MSTATIAYKTNLAALVEWVRQYDGDVDHGAFAEECERIARVVAQRSGLQRLPLGLVPGVPTLDFAAVMVGSSVDPIVYAKSLPGAAAFRKAICPPESSPA